MFEYPCGIEIGFDLCESDGNGPTESLAKTGAVRQQTEGGLRVFTVRGFIPSES
jgi:hypothetical protein